MSALASASALVETALTGDFRRELLAEIAHHADAPVALRRLRDGMRTHLWRTANQRLDFGSTIEAIDASVRAGGFHVLHDWDGKADHVNPESIAVNVLDFVMERHPPGPPSTIVLAILLDYYFAYVLMLLATAALAEPDADAHFDRLNQLVGRLQGPDGSGQLFATDAETLFLIGTSHFEAKDAAYDAVLERARRLSAEHRCAIALGHAASLGSHLRFGFQVTYIKSYPLMRDDNGVDYRWLCFALAVLMEEYERQREGGAGGPDRAVLVEAIANGLSADPDAFVMDTPHASLQPCRAEWTSVRDRVHRYRRDLVEAFKPCRPLDSTYSPIAFFFNFSHNVLKGTVVDALSWAEAWHVSFNDLLTGTSPGDERGAARLKLARTLMGYAQASPDMIGGRLSPVIVYDPITGRRLFADTVRCLES